MNADQTAMVYDAFTQADASTTRKYGGTGLGLTITRKFCEMMGGNISVQSEPNKGSTFTLRLPAEVVDERLMNVVSRRAGATADGDHAHVARTPRAILTYTEQMGYSMALEISGGEMRLGKQVFLLTPLMVIASALAAAEVNVSDQFYSAIRADDKQAVAKLLSGGVDVNTHDGRALRRSCTRLPWVLPAMMRQLIAAGADVNAKNSFDSTAHMLVAAQ
jgi:hypothetical protein